MSIKEFNSIYDNYFWLVYNFAKKKFNYDAAFYAEEVTQHSFVKLWQARDTIKDETKAKWWLMTTALNKIKDIYKHQAWGTLSLTDSALQLPDGNDIERGIIERDVLNSVLSMLNKYSRRQKQIFDLYFLKQMHPKEIAEIFKTKPQTIATQIFSLKERLKADLKKIGINYV